MVWKITPKLKDDALNQTSGGAASEANLFTDDDQYPNDSETAKILDRFDNITSFTGKNIAGRNSVWLKSKE